MLFLYFLAAVGLARNIRMSLKKTAVALRASDNPAVAKKSMKDDINNKENFLSSSLNTLSLRGSASSSVCKLHEDETKSTPEHKDSWDDDSERLSREQPSMSSPRPRDDFSAVSRSSQITESLLQAFVERHRQPEHESRRTWRDDLIMLYQMWPAYLTSSYCPPAVPMADNCANENMKLIRGIKSPETPGDSDNKLQAKAKGKFAKLPKN